MNEMEIAKCKSILEREFGDNWLQIVQTMGTEDLRRRVGKELTSFVAYPARGSGGESSWRGNCAPDVISALLRYVLDCKRYYGKSTNDFVLLDPMSGSGTSKDAADGIGVQSILYDLNPQPRCGKGSWNALKNDVEDSADLVFFHPPYHSIIQYSGNMWGKPHPDDLSRCETYNDFIEKLNYVVKKLYMSLRKDGRLAILVGDIRMKGSFYSMQRDIMKLGELESFIVKAQFNCVSDNRTYKKPFIPIVTEYMLIYHKEDIFMIPFSRTVAKDVDVRSLDDVALTWHHLVRMTIESVGGKAKLSDLYSLLESHPKSRKNEHYKERIRATVYEHKEQYISCGEGCYKLNYQVA